MTYRARIDRSTGTFDLERSDGTIVESGMQLPVDETDASLWETIANDASSNGNIGEAIVTARVGVEIVE